MDREAQHATVHGVARSQTWLSDWTELTTLKFCLVLLHSFTILTRSPEYFCSFYINISFFTLRIHVVEIFLFSNLKNQSLFFFFFFFFPSRFLTSFSFLDLKRVTTLLWIRLWLNGMLWFVWSSIQTTQTFPVSTIRLLHVLIICVFTGMAI